MPMPPRWVGAKFCLRWRRSMTRGFSSICCLEDLGRKSSIVELSWLFRHQFKFCRGYAILLDDWSCWYCICFFCEQKQHLLKLAGWCIDPRYWEPLLMTKISSIVMFWSEWTRKGRNMLLNLMHPTSPKNGRNRPLQPQIAITSFLIEDIIVEICWLTPFLGKPNEFLPKVLHCSSLALSAGKVVKLVLHRFAVG